MLMARRLPSPVRPWPRPFAARPAADPDDAAWPVLPARQQITLIRRRFRLLALLDAACGYFVRARGSTRIR